MRAFIALSLCVGATTAAADVALDLDGELRDTRPPGEVKPAPTKSVRLALDKREEVAPLWGGGVRMTGISGIGALPGRNYGGELAVHVRRDELFGELALGRILPEGKYLLVGQERQIDLGLDTWTARGGWASRNKPLRIWGLAEVGELANPGGMLRGIARMMTMQMPAERRWAALGAGMGVAWAFSDHARLVGSLEFAVPVDRSAVMLDKGLYTPDPAVARTSLGLEVGWK